MKQSYILSLVLGAAAVVAQRPFANLTNTVEKGMRTECKTCPYSLCTNIAAYEELENLTLLCWTRGTVIDSDSTWLRTSDNCYVTQYDLTSYSGTYEDDLRYCGRASEKEFYTTAPARTKYNTECNITPSITADNIHYHKYGKDLTVTCYSDDAYQIINDATWVKTTDNCYVAQIGLTEKVDKSELDPCGPIPHLEINSTYIPPEERTARASTHLPVTLRKPPQTVEENLQKRYLVNVTVGEDYALCHREANSSSTVQRRYHWDQELWLQCLVINYDQPDFNETYWSLTTDFCFVRSVDLWQSPEGDNYRFPLCSRFV